MNSKICYCFGYTAADIRADVRKNQGRSLILEQLLAAKQQESCHCATMHPEGR